MTDQDVSTVTPSADHERVDRSLAEQLVEQARADGVELVGLLAGLTKQVLEAGLEIEMEEHLGYAKHAVACPHSNDSLPVTVDDIGPGRGREVPRESRIKRGGPRIRRRTRGPPA